MPEEYLEYIAGIRRYSRRTCEIYRAVLQEYVDFADGNEMPDMQSIRSYEVHLLDDKKEDAHSVNLHLSVLSGYCAFLMKRGSAIWVNSPEARSKTLPL